MPCYGFRSPCHTDAVPRVSTRMRRVLAVTLAFLATSAAGPSVTGAQSCEAPPGTSAVEQYCEALPEASGTRSANESNRAANASRGRRPPSLSTATAATLEASGSDGRAILNLARGTAAGSRPGGRTLTGETGTAAGEARPPAIPSDNPLRAVQAAASQGRTVGGGLAWTILVGTAALAGVAWVRLRRTS